MRALLASALALLAAVAVPPAAAGAPRLTTFDSCTELVRYARANALRASRSAPLPIALDQEQAAGGSEGASGGEAFSGTNVQEAGVDEPDIVKTDGQRIFALAGGTLHAIDVTGDLPRPVGTLDLGEDASHELLLHAGRALVISQRFDRAGPSTVLTEVDVRDPAALRVVRTAAVEGSPVSARLTGTTARVVLSSYPDVQLAGRRAIRRTRARTWLPGSVTRSGAEVERRPRVVRCDTVQHPSQFSGLEVLTVLTVDMERGLPWVDADAIMGTGEIVYGSARSLYVATQRWSDAVRTEIHRFDAAEPGVTAYSASGAVPGYLLNQFALSEHAGVLRVASTEEPIRAGGEEADESESVVTVLAQAERRLVPVGRLGGLGRGERIYAVRFIGDTGYVVTFRQTDPLYTIDLSTPVAPRLAGELKIPGYSAYLHPLEDGLLLGVGQDATDDGRVTGTQLSLFDVSDAARPVRIAQRTIAAGGSSEVEYDHRAFLYWAPTRLAVLPVQTYFEDRVDGFALGFRLDPATPAIVRLGRLDHLNRSAPVRRALVVGERLFTLSDGGLLASGLADLAPQAWLPFAAR